MIAITYRWPGDDPRRRDQETRARDDEELRGVLGELREHGAVEIRTRRMDWRELLAEAESPEL